MLFWEKIFDFELFVGVKREELFWLNMLVLGVEEVFWLNKLVLGVEVVFWLNILVLGVDAAFCGKIGFELFEGKREAFWLNMLFDAVLGGEKIDEVWFWGNKPFAVAFCGNSPFEVVGNKLFEVVCGKSPEGVELVDGLLLNILLFAVGFWLKKLLFAVELVLKIELLVVLVFLFQRVVLELLGCKNDCVLGCVGVVVFVLNGNDVNGLDEVGAGEGVVGPNWNEVNGLVEEVVVWEGVLVENWNVNGLLGVVIDWEGVVTLFVLNGKEEVDWVVGVAVPNEKVDGFVEVVVLLELNWNDDGVLVEGLLAEVAVPVLNRKVEFDWVGVAVPNENVDGFVEVVVLPELNWNDDGVLVVVFKLAVGLLKLNPPLDGWNIDGADAIVNDDALVARLDTKVPPNWLNTPVAFFSW